MIQSEFDISDLVKEAQSRWLKPAEVLFILQNHENHQLTQEAPKKPTSGSLFLFNKRVLRFFRKDGHSWRKKKDGRTVGEAHERLKVGNAEALNCYYAHGEQNPNFQRRSYWMLDPAYEHIVLVHYRDISEGKHSSGSISLVSPKSSSVFSQSPGSCTTQDPASISLISELREPYQNLPTPGSVEVSSEVDIKGNGFEVSQALRRLEGQLSLDNEDSLSDPEVSQALRKLKEQLSLNDDMFQEIGPLDENSNDFGVLKYGKEISKKDQYADLLDVPGRSDFGNQFARMQNGSNNSIPLQYAGDYGEHHLQPFGQEHKVGNKEPSSWEEMFELSSSPGGNENPLLSSRKGSTEEQESFHWVGNIADNPIDIQTSDASMFLSQEVENFILPASGSAINCQETNPSYSRMLFDQSQNGMPFETNSSLTIAQEQKFSIREISPEWGYSSEVTKVIVIGSFLSNPSESAWTCMFGDIEVPIQIIQDGVIVCQAPPHLPGKVTLCITSGNRESCSEVREFEYRVKRSGCTHCNVPQTEVTKSPEELLLLAKFVQMLLSDLSTQKGDSVELEADLFRKLKADENSWNHFMEALLVGSVSTHSTMDWILQELLKDKLQQWLSSHCQEEHDQSSCLLSKREQGIIHMVAGLGFEWALNPILSCGVSTNFRDINGWTALHWAARFGRERMVAALIAAGASAGALTDPNSQDRAGKPPAFIASICGHKGLAGYLSEVALTSHLSSLTLEETELSKGSAEVEAERTVNSIPDESFNTNEDQISLKDTLAAVRNSAQAAARIQSAFRAHSFRKRLQKAAASVDDYGFSSDDILELSVMSKLAFRNVHESHSAALSIQKKYRGWKGRKDFLAFRKKVITIQAHVRGYQVRKKYRAICWAVGIFDKVVLRWRRGGTGLRRFRQESESTEESEDEDIVRVFRKENVEVAIDQAFSRVMSMVKSPEARQQYRRVLERYRQAKAELGSSSSETPSASLHDASEMEKDDIDMYQFS